MSKQRYDAGEIGHKLREADVLLGQGKTINQVCKKLGIPDQTYYQWRKAYSATKADQAMQLRKLEAENARLERVVTVLKVDKLILKEAVAVNGRENVRK